MTYSSWVSNGTNVAYEPKEKNTGEVITSFSTTAPGGVPNSSYAPSTYVLAASGAWIAQTVATAASEVRRPSVYTELTGNPSPYFIATNTNLVYDADANHISTYGAFELAGLQVQNDASFTYTVFQTKAQTWTSCTLNISRNYASTQWTSGTEARFYLSTDSGITWTLILTDDYDSDPITVAIFSHTLATVNPSSLSAYQVKVEIDAFPSSAFNSVGVLYLQLYDIWIEGIYAVSGGSGTVTSITTTGANGVTISGGSTQTITTSGTFALALGNITPTSITTGTGSFSGDVEFAASIKSPTNSPVTIAPDGTGDVHLNADSVRIGDNNADATIATRGTGDLIITTNEGSVVEGIVRLYDGVNGDITLTPNGSGQVKVGTDQVVTLVASQTLTNKTLTSPTISSIVNTGTLTLPTSTDTLVGRATTDTLTNKTISGSSNTLSNIANASLTNSTISGVALGSNLNALTISSPLTGTSFNGSAAVSIGIPVATTSVNGYLSSTDWTTFNNKGSGSVTSVAATVPSLLSISGSPITTSGTLAITYSGTALPVANGGTGLTTLTAGYIPYGAGTSAFGSSANLFWDSANSYLGIGTASPAFKLHTYIASGTSMFKFESGANTGIYGYWTRPNQSYIQALNLDNNGDKDFSLYDATNSQVADRYYPSSAGYRAFFTNGSERLRIDSSGNVGIGTATSSGLLTLKNNPSGSAENVLIGLQQNGASTGTIGKLSYQQSDDTMRLYNSSSFAGSALILGTNNTERLRIDSSGNVGIGTASPYNKVEIEGASARLGLNNGGGASRKALLIEPLGYGGNTYARLESYDYGTSTGGILALNVTGGNVGIGTASPQAKLHILDKMKVSDSTQGLGLISLGDGSTTAQNVGIWRGSANSVSSAGNFLNLGGYEGIVFTSGNTSLGSQTERVRIDVSGNVGIGVTPSAWGSFAITQYKGGFIGSQSSSYLYTGQNTYFNGTDFKYVSTAAVTMLEQSFGAFVFYRAASGTAGNTVSFSESCRIDSSGNVGIGTSSPASKLNVSGGNVTVSAGYGIAWSGDQARIMTPEDNVSGALIRYGSGGICRFLNGSTEHLRVDSSGNLAALGVFKGNSGTKGFGGITTTTSTSTPTGGSSGDHYYIY